MAKSRSKKSIRSIKNCMYFGLENPTASTITDYQQTVNNLTGALGPTNSAYWAKVGSIVGPSAELSSQPLFYAPGLGSKYVTAFDQNASWTPWSLDKNVASFGTKKNKSRTKKKIVHKSKSMAKKKKSKKINQ